MKETNFPSRQDYWKALIREMRSSPLSKDEFAKSKNVSKSSLVSWARRLGESLPAAQGPRKRRVRKVGNDFLIVEPEAKPGMRSRVETVKIVFPSGAAIHFTERPDAEWLSLMMKLIA